MRLPQPPPKIDRSELLARADVDTINRIFSVDSTLPDGRYLPWDELRHREPPHGLSHLQWWAGVHLRRSREAQRVEAMERVYGIPFRVDVVAAIQRQLHEFDRTNVGSAILSALGNSDAQIEYQVRQLIEEAISSSEIEGARPTTRELARQMLRERRQPASRDEQMIFNNLRAMEHLGQLRKHTTSLTIDHLLELHRILGEGALEVAGAEGKFRTSERQVEVSDAEGNVWHIPPPAAGLEDRVRHLLAFANGEDPSQRAFVHPILRAIITHFWLGYEHPFRDGNGRIARALYYWCMMKSGYEIAEFLSISGPIDRSPAAYYKAFAYTESDEGDLTYFVLHQLDVMRSALTDLLAHLRIRTDRLNALAKAIASYDQLNYRQRSVLEFAIRHPMQGQTIASHANSHGVHYLTARTDLKNLEERGLLVSRRHNKTKRYYPSATLTASTLTPRGR